jgi:hypothetical protein
MKVENGVDTSLRHCKKRLANEIIRLEQIAEQEAQWERHWGEHRYHQAHSAAIALKKHWREFDEGKYTLFEDNYQAFMCIQSRKHQIASDIDHPVEQDEDKRTVKRLRWTQEQKDFTHKATVPSVEETDAQSIGFASSLKRNRRSYRAKVSFHTDILVSPVRDIDVIRKTLRDPSTASHKMWLPTRGILRTTASTPFYPGISDMSPKDPHYIIPLANDNRSRHKHSYPRRMPEYQAGRWAPSSDSKAVSTEGGRQRMKQSPHL